MKLGTKIVFFVAMICLGVVSIFTTYVSLSDSILPEPTVTVNLGYGVVHKCSVFALVLSVAIGLMLFALKVAIVDEQKRLNLLGLVGLTIIAFVSISFNLDVLYRWADRDFFINHSTSRMKSAYEDYLEKTQAALIEKRDTAMKSVARQEGELDAEIRGLRKAPEGYGKLAKEEDYKLTLLQKTSAVELQTVEEAMTKKEEADTLLASSQPKTLDEIQQLQHQIRVVVKDVGAVSGIALPEPVKLESPLFAVFNKIFDYKSIGTKEIFLIIIAFIIDLGDIIGYSLVPNAKKKRRIGNPSDVPEYGGPEFSLPSSPRRSQVAVASDVETPLSLPEEPVAAFVSPGESEVAGNEPGDDSEALRRRHPYRPFGFRR